MTSLDVEATLAQLTLEEKAGLTSGASFWYTKPVERAGVGVVMVADGPHGLRKQPPDGEQVGIGGSIPATCFPPAATLASTWDPALLRRVGESLGAQTRAESVSVLLGPGVNIKRSPLCGRNFEYFSEDPLVAGTLGAALVQGVQSAGVGTSLKHFAANNQETERMRVSAEIDERTLRELYLPAFEQVVTTAQPWTVMCSYNRVNGTYASEHHELLTQILRDEWGFEGVVVSDWGAVHDRPVALAAGLDLMMPGAGAYPDEAVVAAVRAGELDEAVLDLAVRRLLRLVARAQDALAAPGTVDHDADHALAREAAAAGTVLLRNEPVDGTPVLPLSPEALASAIVVGEFARTPRIQGGGSSHVEATRVDDALTSLRAAAGREVPFHPGYTVPPGAWMPRVTPEEAAATEAINAALRAEAVAAAAEASVVLAFVGLPDCYESEGADRTHLNLPPEQVALLTALTAVNRRVVVVLSNGAVVDLSAWQSGTAALLEAWLGGQAGGSAIVDLLLGVREPEGRLAETIPLRLQDTPTYGAFPGDRLVARYGEGLLVGYRWYDTREADVAYPFGFGLGYTTFGYSDLAVAVVGQPDDALSATRVEVSVTVTNTGQRPGAEVVQVYVGDPEARVMRPTHELRAFTKVRLAPGSSERVTFTLTGRDLSYWSTADHAWRLESGAFVIEVGSSSRDIRATATVDVAGPPIVDPLTITSTYGEWMSHPVGGPLLAPILGDPAAGMTITDEQMGGMDAMPLVMIVDFGVTPLDHAGLVALIAEVNTN